MNLSKTMKICMWVFISIFILSSINAAWWNDSYEYKQEINLSTSSGTTLNNYQVKIVINSSNNGTNWNWTQECVNSNSSRARFVNENETSKLDFWVESCSQTSKTVTYWVKVDKKINTTNSSIYLYYGNAVANPISNGKETFDFFDSFDSLNSSIWTGTGSNSVSNSELFISTGSVYTSSTVLNSSVNKTVESKVKWSSSSGSYSGIMISDSSSTSGSNSGSDALAYYMTQSGSLTVSWWAADGTTSSYNLGYGDTFTATLNNNYIVGITVSDSNITFYKNYSLQATSNLGNWNAPFYLWHGYFTGAGAGSTNIKDIYVDWTRVRKHHDGSISIKVGNEKIIPKIETTLESPIENYSTALTTIQFNCSVYNTYDNSKLSNITLYLNNSGWYANETKTVSGNSNWTTFTKTLLEGTYKWNCLGKNNNSNSDWGNQNRTFVIESIPPTVTIHSPIGTIADVTPTINVSFGETVDTAWYRVNSSSQNVTLCKSCSSVDDVYLHLPEGNYKLFVYANDTAGNINNTEFSIFTIDMNDNYYDSFNDNSSLDMSNDLKWNRGNITLNLKTQNSGDGSDGSLDVSSVNTIVNNYTYLSANEGVGNTTLSVNDSTEFSTGDEILIIQMQNGSGSGSTGTYEFATISSTGVGTITINSPITNSYGSGTFGTTTSSVTQIVRVPQYTDVTINSGASITAPSWNGYTGGIVVFKAQGSVNTTGYINVSEKGYRGGAVGTSSNQDGWQAESYYGIGQGDGSYCQYRLANEGGGGSCITGAGGGYANAGTNSADWNGGGGSDFALGGSSYGSANLNKVFFGSGGGGIWNGADSTQAPGGNGGGIILIYANTINAKTNTILSYGESSNGYSSGSYNYGAGGGAGGSIILSAYKINGVTNFANSTLGKGKVPPAISRAGGDGSVGRIRLNFNTLNGTTYPNNYNGSASYVSNTGNFTAKSINTTKNITEILNVTWNEANTDTNNNISVQISVNGGSNWYNVTKNKGVSNMSSGNSLIYRVFFSNNASNEVSLLDMNITWTSDPQITIHSPLEGRKYFDTNNTYANISSNVDLNYVAYFLDGNYSQKIKLNNLTPKSWNILLENLTYGKHNVTFYYNTSEGKTGNSSTVTFYWLRNSNLKITKQIISENIDQYLINTSIVNNLVNSTYDYSYVDFIPNNLNLGSPTPAFSFFNTTNGVNFNGRIYVWNLNTTITNVTYSLAAIGDYEVKDLYVVGLE